MLKKLIFNAGFYSPNRHGGLGNFAKAGLEHPRANGLYETYSFSSIEARFRFSCTFSAGNALAKKIF